METEKIGSVFSEKVEVRPAPAVWTEPTPSTLDEQEEYFEENGFLIFRGLLSRNEVDELKSDLDQIAAGYGKIPSIREGFNLEPEQDNQKQAPTFRKIGGLVDQSDAFLRLSRYPVILKVVQRLLGTKLELWRDTMMMKTARVGREKPWHQDSVYWPWRPMRLISTMTALEGATPENGCLQIIPGTHKTVLQHYAKEHRIDLDEELQARAVYVTMDAGDCLLFHSLLLHASEPNLSDRDRPACLMAYMSTDLEYIGKGERPERPMVSGD